MSEVSGISEEACVYRLLMRHGRAGALRAFTRMKEIESWPDQSVLIAVELLLGQGAQLVEDPLDSDNTLAWAQARVQQTDQPNGPGHRLLKLLLHSNNHNDSQLNSQQNSTQDPSTTNAWGDRPAEDVLTVMKHVLKYSKDEQRQIVLHHPYNATALLAAAAREGRAKRDVVHWALAMGAPANGINLHTIRSRRTKRETSTSDISQQHNPVATTPSHTQQTLDSTGSGSTEETSDVAQTVSETATQPSRQMPCDGQERTQRLAEAASHNQDQLQPTNAQPECNGLPPNANLQPGNPFRCQCNGTYADEVEHHCQPDDDSSDADALLAMGADIDCRLHTCNGCSHSQQLNDQCSDGTPNKQTGTGLHIQPCNGDSMTLQGHDLSPSPIAETNGHPGTAASLRNSNGFTNGIAGQQRYVSELTASSAFAKQFSSQGFQHIDINGTDLVVQSTDQNGFTHGADKLPMADSIQPNAIPSNSSAATPQSGNEISTQQEGCEGSQPHNVRLTEEELKREAEKWVISPLAEAAAAGDSYLVELLIMVHEADPAAYGGLAERMAAKHGHHQLAKYIYEQVLERQAAKRGLRNKLADSASANGNSNQGSVVVQSPSYQYVTLGDWVKSVMPTWSGLKRAIMGSPQPRSRVKHARVTHGKQAPVTYHSSPVPQDINHKVTSKRMLYGVAAIATAGAAGYLMYRVSTNSRTSNNSDNKSNAIDANTVT